MLSKSKVKYIQTLGQKKFRQEEGLFIAEGPKVVSELLYARHSYITEIMALPDWLRDNAELTAGISCTEINEADLERISQLSTPNQVIAVVKQFDNDTIPVAAGQLTLVLDNIQDPGNLGTIIRMADWFGLQQVLCSDDTVDVYNPKVVQATMGSIARVNVHTLNIEEWINAQQNIPVLAAALDGKDIRLAGKPAEAIIIIGNEAKGISPAVMQLASEKITITGRGHAESLNAAVATGIILSHLT